MLSFFDGIWQEIVDSNSRVQNTPSADCNNCGLSLYIHFFKKGALFHQIPYSPQECFFPDGLLKYNPVHNYVNDKPIFYIIACFY